MDPKGYPSTFGITPPTPSPENDESLETPKSEIISKPPINDQLKMVVNELRGPEQGKPIYPTPSQILRQSASEALPIFDQESLCTLKLRLKKLQNLKTTSMESSEEYLIRIMFMGNTYAKLLSGTVDIASLVQLTRHPESKQSRKKFGNGLEKVSEVSPAGIEGIDGELEKQVEEEDPLKSIMCADIHLLHETRMELRYIDMLDNPIVCSISLVKDVPEKIYGTIEPFGYLTLDTLTLLQHRAGVTFRIPWVLIPERTPYDRVPGLPILIGEVEGHGGLPTFEQLQYGNMASIVVESMYRLPKEILALTVPNNVQAEIYLRFPCPENYYVFPGGELRKIIYTNTLEQFDSESCEEPDGCEKFNSYEIPTVDPATGIPIYVNDTNFCFHRHWASVQEFYPDIPFSATALLQSRCIPMNDENLVGDMKDEIGITGDSTWEEFLTSFDSRISWNALHRLFMSPENYREMLKKMSKQTIWPMEIVFYEKPKDETTDQLDAKSSEQITPAPNASDVQIIVAAPQNNGPTDLNILYHGVAFLDFSKALEPGVKTIRLALRVHPYSEAGKIIQTCGMGSIFLDILNGKMDSGKFEDERSNLNSEESMEKMEIKNEKKKPVPSREQSQSSNFSDIQRLLVNPNAPFIICQLNFRRPIIPSMEEEDDSKLRSHYKPMQKFQKKTLQNATSAQVNYRKAVLEASSELSHEFHATYMEEIIKHGIDRKIVNSKDPKGSFESIKKGFLFYLNASGRYLVLREHLRHAVADIVEQKCLNAHPQGFKTQRQFQTFLHDLYMWMVDEMHEVLNTSSSQELNLLELKKGGDDRKNMREVEFLLTFAQEAFAQGDYENAHRIHVERIAQSNNSAQAWIDFGIMWLSRGDDRLAEIAIQEALKVEPSNLLALIVGGGISATHRDPKSLTYLNCALRQRPNCPELLVLVAWAHTSLGNDIAAEYYFQQARYIHHVLTGRDTSVLDKDFQKVSYTMRQVASQSPEMMNSPEEQETSQGTPTTGSLEEEENSDNPAAPVSELNIKLSPKNKPLPKSRNGPKNFDIKITRDNLETTRLPTLGPDLAVTWNVTKATRGKMHIADIVMTDPISSLNGSPNAEENLLKKLDEMLEKQTRFDIPIPLTYDEIQLQLHRKKPSLRKISSFLQRNPGISRIHTASSHRRAFGDDSLLANRSNTSIAAGNDPNRYSLLGDHYVNPYFHAQIPKEGIFPDHHHHGHGHDHDHEKCDHPDHDHAHSTEEQGEDDQEDTHEDVERSHGHHDLAKFFRYHEHTHHHHPRHHHRRQQGTDELIPINKEEEEVNEDENKKAIAVDVHEGPAIKAISVAGTISTRTIPYTQYSDSFSSDSFSHSTSSSSSFISSTESFRDEEMAGEDFVQSTPHIFTKRVGSEYIWAGHVLLKLRLFDCLDGLMAKEIALNPERGIEFLYIRAMSLHLRGRDNEALEFIEEGLKIDSENGPLWALRGHAFYSLRDTKQAMFSYEKVLTLPHGRESLHLVYLRFGALCLEKNDPVLAKRLFLKRAQVTSTPYLWIAIGNTSYYLKEYEEAELAFAEANRLDNTNPIIWGHLALVSLTLGHQTLAEQSFKWAIRFGLKDCKLMEEIKELHKKLGFGNPAFPRIPHCIPHEYYLQRIGRDKPFEAYKEALSFPEFGKVNRRFENSERENELIKKLREKYAKEMEAKQGLAQSSSQSRSAFEDGEFLSPGGSEIEVEGLDEEEEMTTPATEETVVKQSARKLSKLSKGKGAGKKRKGSIGSNK